jgi:hypothetical protein
MSVFFGHGGKTAVSTNSDAVVVFPPFSSMAHALMFCATLVFFAFAPLVLQIGTPESYISKFKAMPLTYENYLTVAHFLESDEKLDVVIIGSSETWASLDPNAITGYLENTGSAKGLRGLNAATNWAGFDRSLIVLKSILERKKPRLVLMGETQTSAGSVPHYLSKFFWNGEFNDLLGSPALRLKYYAMRVLGAPHEIWRRYFSSNATTDGIIADVAKLDKGKAQGLQRLIHNNGFQGLDLGWTTTGEEGSSADSKAISAKARYHPATPQQAADIFWETELPDYVVYADDAHDANQTRFLQAIAKLCKDKGIVFASVVLPINFKDTVASKLVIRPLAEGAKRDWPMIGLPMNEVFKGLSLEQAKAYYHDMSHFNKAGGETYTELLLPGIRRLYENQHLR